jgi:hypothetical protein
VIAATSIEVATSMEVFMKPKLEVLFAIITLFVVAIQMQAHHPFANEFDANKPITLKGTVTKFEWVNPHAILSMDVKDQNGQITNWTVEMGAPKKLKDFGWKKDLVKPGDEITVNAWCAKDGSNRASANTITLPDGAKMTGGSSYYDARPQKTPTTN